MREQGVADVAWSQNRSKNEVSSFMKMFLPYSSQTMHSMRRFQVPETKHIDSPGPRKRASDELAGGRSAMLRLFGLGKVVLACGFTAR